MIIDVFHNSVLNEFDVHNAQFSWVSLETSQELGNCPMGQREALLKERPDLEKA